MIGVRRWGAVVLAAGLLVIAPAARADPGSASTALRTQSVYVDPAAKDRGVRLGAVTLPASVKIAVLPDTGVPALRLAAQLASRVDAAQVTVGVFTIGDDGQVSFHATSTRYCAAYADQQARLAAAQLGASLDLTRTVAQFAQRLTGGPSDTASCADSVSAAETTATRAGTAWPWLVGVAALSALGITALVMGSRRARARRPDVEFDGGQWW